MSSKSADEERRRSKADKQLEVALHSGLPEDSSGIDSNPVYRKLAPTSEAKYASVFEFWKAYKRKYPEANPCEIVWLKHFAQAIARSTISKLDEQKATVQLVRVKVRSFTSQWQRETHQSIPKHVRKAMAPYIEKDLCSLIPLSNTQKAPTFLTIQNYGEMEELLWKKDYHNYVHEGCRVDKSTLLKVHCYSSARLQEICNAKYEDLLCMIAWKDEEPEIKLEFKREQCKGMADDPKKPKHPIYERLDPAPPLFANALLFLLSIFISRRAFKKYRTLEDVLAARAPKGKYQIMEWADNALGSPVFSEMTVDGLTEKAKTASS
ncbi:hypothetical protein VE02_01553 [Pseudogymnoascus sp. 03VT05]|nr:hypothetical protein VE02_01553 [Pseudogymnoascus sp. 03VT05]